MKKQSQLQIEVNKFIPVMYSALIDRYSPNNGTIECATIYGRAKAKPSDTIAGMASSHKTNVRFILRIPSWYSC